MARLSIQGVSLAQARRLVMDLMKREKKAARLYKLKTRLVAKLNQVNEQIAAYGVASPAIRRGRKAGKKAMKAMSRHARQAVGTLKEVAAQVLAQAESMGLTELANKVLKAGYKTKSDTRVFLTALQGILSKHAETFQRVKRGVYALKSPRAAAPARRARRTRKVAVRRAAASRPSAAVRSRGAAAERTMQAGA